MKHIKHLFAVIMLFCFTHAYSHDFETGGICYKITSSSNKSVEVSYKGSSYTFYNPEYEGAVVIPSTVTYGGVTYNVTAIGDNAFYACTELTRVEIPSSVTSVGAYAFFGCSKLKSVIIPNNVKSIGDYAFYKCDNITHLTIGNGVTSIGNYAFCNIGYNNDNCKVLNFSVNELSKSGDFEYADAIINAPSATVVDNFVFDASGALIGYMDVATEITLPDYYKGAKYAIGDYAFFGFEDIKSVVIGKGVTSIGNYAFQNCTGLLNITIPNNVKSIGNWSFQNCTGLANVSIGSGVESIGSYAFQYCTGLTSVFIPSNVTSLGYYAFGYCSNLTQVSVPDGVTSISAFGHCSSLTSITVPSSVTNIGSFALYKCSALTSITIPAEVKRIGMQAFNGCTELNEVYISDIAAWCSIDFGSNANPLFYTEKLYLNGKLLTDLNVPNSITEVKDYTFYNNKALKSILVPDAVTAIGEYSFYSCAALQSVTIGKGIKSIGTSAFTGCTSLKEISVKATTPATVTSNTFEGLYDTATLYVPTGTKAAYQAADVWKKFANIVEKNFGIRGDVNNDGAVSVTDIQSIVNLILRAATISDNPMADVNGDGTISVTDIQSVVNIILNISNTAPARAASRVLSAASSTLYIEPFSINAGEEKEIAVLLDNAGDSFTSLQFDLYLPQGIEVVRDNKGYFLELGSRSSYHGHSEPLCAVLDDDSYRMLCYSGSSELFRDESGDVIKITVRAAEGLADGVYELAVRNVELSRPDETCYNPSATTAAITVGGTTGIEDVNGEMIKEKEEIFDLQGRKIYNPTRGVYIIDGKKVLVK